METLELFALISRTCMKKFVDLNVIDLKDRKSILFQGENNFRSEPLCPILKLQSGSVIASCQSVKKKPLV